MTEQQLPVWADPSVSPSRLDAQGVSRRQLLRRAGLFSAAFAAGSLATPAAAHGQGLGGNDPRLAYLVGDHHIHTVYSHDAKYTFSQLAAAGAEYGLDWMVFTEHSNFGHAQYGAPLERKEILDARAENPRQLIFQGLEWYIPAAEHATVFAAPGPREVDLLTRFELAYDGKLLGCTDGAADNPNTARNQAHAVKAIKWLAEQRRTGYVDDVLVLANHPMRLGIDSPYEMRDWRDAASEIMIGMEGAPGAQGAAIPGWRGTTSIRGEYENKPSAQSWPGYPADAYLTYGGFDWATATVGGLWDAMLAEGKLFSVTTNSDAHRIVFDTWKNGDWAAGQNFDNTGKLPDPVNTDTPQPGSDFWPGQFSRTHVGVTRYGYRSVMAGLRAGRVWLDHGHLIDGLDVRLKRDRDQGRGVTMGGRLRVRKGDKLTLSVTVTSASRPNPQGILPELAHVDVIRGAVHGPAARDDWKAPDTKVVRTVDVSGRKGTYTLRIPLVAGDESFYIRLRGSDGNRNGTGYLGATVDPHGPITHAPGNGDPWADTWFYANPIFVDVAGA
ncbi:PHP domain-containing protein [Streptomyces sp. NBC_00620]|uniref:PHP domain-containing protein n=1 Tax=Streptomyces sp. NBC_00620 TaxID=2903666 RepID=UPI002253A052|nr:PHP domain-containing protein [Streptomyces sp. NBC_00620]MCX4978388.1 PHP domain-containing protein [Streptomyces sp. NBC_00620]